MKPFARSFWASLLAFIVAGAAMMLLSFMIISAIAGSFSSAPKEALKGSALVYDFSEAVVDAPSSDLSSSLSISVDGISMVKSVTLYSLLSAVEEAAEDENIKGIILDYSGSAQFEGTAQIEEFRQALLKFRESGKFIISWATSYTTGGYWLASVSDKVYIAPEGEVLWQGIASQVMFYKGLIDKLGIDVDIIRHGTFKSAVEPYMTDSMSPANRLQMETLMNSMWGQLLSDVKASRSIPVERLQEIADSEVMLSPDKALEFGLIDGIMYRDEFNRTVASMLSDSEEDSKASRKSKDSEEEESEPDYPSITFSDYIASTAPGKKISKNKIAVVYASGEIVDGGSSSDITPEATIKQLRKAADDDAVKAVVFRVNSPGGSALASEQIWHEVSNLRETKPVIVSMGNYAASGGYYISCPADVILTDRTTLTGSIGVFGVVPSFGDALKDNLGITVDVAKSAESADMATGFRSLTPRETEIMTQSVERVYTVFVDHVSKGRNMLPDEVDAIGQGRVWSGTDAGEIGLVDGIGGLKDAIVLAAERAGVMDDFRVYEIKETPDAFTAALQQMMVRTGLAKVSQADAALSYYKSVMNMTRQTGVQARMLFFIEIR